MNTLHLQRCVCLSVINIGHWVNKNSLIFNFVIFYKRKVNLVGTFDRLKLLIVKESFRKSKKFSILRKTDFFFKSDLFLRVIKQLFTLDT